MKPFLLRNLVIAFILFSLSWSQAQTTIVVHGQVTNFQNQPLAGHQVTIMVDSAYMANPPFSYNGTVTTDANGYYMDSVVIPAGVTSAFVIARVMDCVNNYHSLFQIYIPNQPIPAMNFSICSSLPPGYSCDAGISNIPINGSLPIQTSITVFVKNYGNSNIQGGMITANLSVNGGSSQQMVVPGLLFSMDSVPVTFNNVVLQSGTNTICASTTLACDSNPSNNMFCISVNSFNSSSLPFTENFDSTNTFYTDSTSIWQHGTPNGAIINTAFSTPNAWVTNLNGNYPNNATSFLYSPTYNFQGLGMADTVILTIRHYCAMQTGDYGRIEYSVNGGQTWLQLGFYLDALGSNWYNGVASGVHHFSYYNSGWMQSSYKLVPATFNGMPQVQFRFHFYSNTSGVSEGWAIDNFSLSLNNTAVHAGVTNITFPVNDTLAGISLNATITITNFTSQPITNVPLQLRLNGVVVSTGIYAGLISGNQSVNYTFAVPYVVPTGPYQLCARTQIPGGITNNTEYCRYLNGLGSPTGYVYGLLSTGMGAAGPSEVYLIQHDPVSGTLTALDTTLSVDSAGVTTYYFSAVPPGSYLVKAAMLPSNPNYATNIPTYYSSSLFWSQATPLQVLPNGFTQASITYVQGINPGGPGFVGGLVTQGANKGPGDPLEGVQVILLDAGNNDEPVAVAFSDAQGQFSFSNIPLGTYKVYTEMLNKVTIPAVATLDATNPVISNIKIIVGSTVITSVMDLEPSGEFIVGSPYPNPVTGTVNIPLQILNGMVLKAEITDLSGRKIKTLEIDLSAGQHLWQIDLSAMQSGLYLCTLSTPDGYRRTEKINKK